MLKYLTLVAIWLQIRLQSVNACNVWADNNPCGDNPTDCTCYFPKAYPNHVEYSKHCPKWGHSDGDFTKCNECATQVILCGDITACNDCAMGNINEEGSLCHCTACGCAVAFDTGSGIIPLNNPNNLLGFLEYWNIDELPGGTTGLVATGAVASTYALFPSALTMFPPQGLPQPGATLAGGGSIPAAALTSAVVAAEVSFLVVGISGAVVLAVFSSALPGTFIVSRTVPATAALFTEPDIATIGRQSVNEISHHHQSCGRPVINLAAKFSTAQKNIISITTHGKFSPALNIIYKPIATITSLTSRIKHRVYNKMGIRCVFPKLIKPFEPILRYVRCKLGMDNDGFMEVPQCQSFECAEPSIEEKSVTHDRGLPNLENMIEGDASTIDDCFSEMKKMTYGARIQAKLVDDKSCDEPRYEALCEELLGQNRTLNEDDCLSPSCSHPSEDPYRACFGCEFAKSRYDHEGNYYPDGYQDYDHVSERQTGERFQATRQSRRVICRRGQGGRRLCKIRVDRAMQIRKETYARAQHFIQSENYLSSDDLDIIRK